MIHLDKSKTWQKATDDEKVAYCEELFTETKQARSKRDFEWYLNYMFEEGHHYTQYNTTTNALERPPHKKGEVRLVINKIKSSKRSVSNYATRFDPRWEIVPGDIDDETIINARRCGKLLGYLYRKLHLETVIRGLVDTGLSTSVGWVEMGWDSKASGGLGEVLYRLHDPFDIYPAPSATLYAGKLVSRYLAKTNRRSLDEIYYDERYDKKNRRKVIADSELSSSAMKARIIRKERGGGTDEKTKEATVKEFYLWDNEKNSAGGNLTLFTYSNGQKLREKDLKDKEYPIYLMQIPQDPLKIYHRAWLSDAVGLNKALDRSLSQKLMYVNKALVYRIIAEKGHGASTQSFGNEQGEIVEVNPGRKFEQWRMDALPATLDSLSNDLNFHLEDALAAHEASIGRLPTGARSGKTLEALQAAEANTLSGLRQSLESFLAITGKKALEIMSEKYVASRIIEITEPEFDENGQRMNYLKVIGEGAKNKPKGAVIIPSDSEVIVKIGSNLGYTLEAQRETLKELASLGAIPSEEILRQYEFPNIDELSKRAKEERLEAHVLDAEIAGRNQPAQGGAATPQAGGQGNMAGLADQENMAMMNGDNLPPTQGADLQHTQAHVDFAKSDIFMSAPPDRQQVIVAHIQGELQAQGVA